MDRPDVCPTGPSHAMCAEDGCVVEAGAPGDWIQTYSGLHVNPLDMKSEDIVLKDIAHALSCICRYGGHCARHYSVAEHSMRLAWYFESNSIGRRNPDLCLWALLHDAAEAYLGDIPRPLKRSISFQTIGDTYVQSFYIIEERILNLMAKKWHLTPLSVPAEVKQYENYLMKDEARILMGNIEGWFFDEDNSGLGIDSHEMRYGRGDADTVDALEGEFLTTFHTINKRRFET